MENKCSNLINKRLLKNLQHLWSSDSSYTVIPEANNCSIICELFSHLIWKFCVSSSMNVLFYHINYQVCVTHNWVVHLERPSKLLMNWDLGQPISNLWDYVESMRGGPVMHLFFPNIMRDCMCLWPCVL